MEPSPAVLFVYHGLPQFYPAPPLSDRLIVAGPFVEDLIEPDGRVRRLKTPFQGFDMADVLARIPREQMPQVMFVRVDAARSVEPFNTAAFPGLRVVLLGDTHHMRAPIRKISTYLKAEPYDWVASYNNLHHAHFFQEQGIDNLIWLPGITVTPLPAPFAQDWLEEPVVAFVGNLETDHVRRRELLDLLRAEGIGLAAGQARGAEAARIYSRHRLSFNCSLNGDLNMRVFEVLSAGGLLLTDRLAPATGLPRLLTEGEHYVAYDGPDELLAVVRHYLAHPEEAGTIARAGHQQFQRMLGMDVLRPRLWRLADGEVAPLFQAEDPRTALNLAAGHAAPATMDHRIWTYDHLQNVHGAGQDIRILFLADDPGPCYLDLQDLRRATIATTARLTPAVAQAVLAVSGAPPRILEREEARGMEWDAVYVQPDRIDEGAAILDAFRTRWLGLTLPAPPDAAPSGLRPVPYSGLWERAT